MEPQRQTRIHRLAQRHRRSPNAQRSLDLHNQISAFFAQPRYENVVAFYGLVNEPKMTILPVPDVLNWTTSAINIVRQNGIAQTISVADGFLGLPNWQGKLQGIPGLVLDAHQYVIFNQAQIAFTHQNKINFACSGWDEPDGNEYESCDWVRLFPLPPPGFRFPPIHT